MSLREKLFGGSSARKHSDRYTVLLDGISKEQTGLEIGPFFAPLVPKSSGYKSFSIDVFSADELREKAQHDSAIRADDILKIEDVDFIGDASQMTSLVEAAGLGGELDYIISSHNFEHLPNPIGFLQSVERLLKVGGRLIMAVPDRRTCFDYFKPHSTTADFLEAYFEGRSAPTPRQRFECNSLLANYIEDGKKYGSFALSCDPGKVHHIFNLDGCFAEWKESIEGKSAGYLDAHCWFFTPASIAVILADLKYLGLIDLDVESIEGPSGNEFYVKMARPEHGAFVGEYTSQRQEMLHRINEEAAESARAFRKSSPTFFSSIMHLPGFGFFRKLSA